MDFKNPKKKSANQNSWDSCKMFDISKKKTIPAFVKFKISNNFKRNIDGPNSKQLKIQRKIHNSLRILKISRKKSANQSWDYCQMFVIFKKKTIPEGMVQSSLWIFILSDFNLWFCKFRVDWNISKVWPYNSIESDFHVWVDALLLLSCQTRKEGGEGAAERKGLYILCEEWGGGSRIHGFRSFFEQKNTFW